MIAIATFDLATSTGYAIREPGANRPRSGSFRMPKTGEEIGPFLTAFHGETCALIGPLVERYGPENVIVVFEMPYVGPNTAQATARKLMGLATHLEYICYRGGKKPGIRVFEANNASVRKHFIGKGRGKRAELKAMTLAECKARGWIDEDSKDEDEADALALLDYVVHCMRLPGVVAGPLFRSAA